MSDERALELISAAADGELDSRERAEVEQLLRESAAARAFRDDLRRLRTLLADLPAPAFPDGLHARIMSDAGRTNRERTARWHVPVPGLALRYGLAAAAGVVLAVGVYEWRPAADGGYGELAGTMLPEGSRAGTRVLDRETTQAAEFTGLVELQQSGEQLLLDIRLDAAESVELTIDFAAAGLRPVGVSQPRFPFKSIEMAEQVLQARGLGRQHVSVSLRREEYAAAADEAAIRLEYSSGGRVLEQGSLSSAME